MNNKFLKIIYIFIFVAFLNPKTKTAQVYDVANVSINLMNQEFLMTDFGYTESGRIPSFYSVLVSGRDPSDKLTEKGFKVEQFYKVAE